MSSDTAISQGKWKALAPLLVLAAGIAWGFIGLFTKQLSAAGLSALQITETRCLTAATLLVALSLVSGKGRLRIKLRDAWMFLGTGVCSIALFNICYFACIEASTLSIAATLLYTSPIFIMLMSAVLFKERITKVKLAALVLACVGCACVTGFIGGGSAATISPFALAVGLGSGFCYGLYSIFARFALRKYEPITVTTYTFLFAGVALLPLSDAPAIAQTIIASPTAMLAAVMLAAASTVLPFMLYTLGLSHMDAGKAGVIAAVEPVVATIVSVTVFHEAFALNNAVGITLVMCAIVLLSLFDGKRKAPREN